MLLFAGIDIIATLTVFVIVAAYNWHKLHYRNQEIPQGSHQVFCVLASFIFTQCIHLLQLFMRSHMTRLPQTESAMEQCPAYGVLTK